MNSEALRKTAEQLRAHPEAYSQRTYGRAQDCGTVGCVASNALLANGYTTARCAIHAGCDAVEYILGDHRLDIDDVPYVAARILGLTPIQASGLFASMPEWLQWYDGHESELAARECDRLAAIAEAEAGR